MVTTSKDLKIRYTADTSGVRKGVDEIDKANEGLASKLKSVGAKMTTVGKSATLGLTLPLVAFGKVALDSFGEASQVAAQTAAVIKSTGNAAGTSVDKIGALSDKIGALAGVDNDAVQAGANMLLTFTNVRNEAGKGNDVFDQSLMTLQDMASAMGKDTKSSAIALGKALNDPVKGITALSRVGVTFTEQQKKQIANMVKVGDTAGAQKVILAELNKEFGGSAAAAGKTITPMQKIALQMDDLGESVGAVLAPMLEKLVGWVSKVAEWFNELSPSAKQLAVRIALIAAVMGPVLIIGGKLVSAIGAISGAFGKLASANPWFLIIAGLVVLVVLIVKHWDTIKRIILAVWDAIKGAALAVWDAIKGVVLAVWGVLKGIAKAYIAIYVGAFKAVRAIATAVWHAISAVVKIAWAIILTIAKVAVAIVSGYFTAIKVVAVTVWNGIVGAVKIAWATIKGIGNTIKTFFGGIWHGIQDVAETVWNAISTTIGNIWDGIVGVVKLGVNGIIVVLNGVIDGINLLIRGVNLIKPGADISSISQIPLLANGGRIMRSGLAVVGERGPELLSLGRGATVAPLSSTDGSGVYVLNLDRRRFGRGLELESLTRGR